MYLEVEKKYDGNTKIIIGGDGRVTVKIQRNHRRYTKRLIAVAQEIAAEKNYPSTMRSKVRIRAMDNEMLMEFQNASKTKCDRVTLPLVPQQDPSFIDQWLSGG